MSKPGIHHCIEDLIAIFNATFSQSYATRLQCGDGEPIYKPASNRCAYHRIVFAHGFYRSALHEIAHWCIAGKVRRQLTDYGYWYQPDGRSALQQRQFERVEVKPQALEWLFCLSAGHSFVVSCDNLASTDPEAVDEAAFKQAVQQQLQRYLRGPLPPRAAQFAQALQAFYQQPQPQEVA